MSRRRFIAAGFLSAVIAAVLAVIVYTEHATATQTTSVWMLTHDVTGGAPYAASDVQQVMIHAEGSGFNYETLGPSSFAGRYARNLNSGDILRQDDIVALDTEAEVAVTVQDPPPLTAGDRIDIFATFNGDQQALIGRSIQVETVAGGVLTILVPVADEQAWVAVGSSSVALHVARGATGPPGDPQPVSATGAIRLLCGVACGAASPQP